MKRHSGPIAGDGDGADAVLVRVDHQSLTLTAKKFCSVVKVEERSRCRAFVRDSEKSEGPLLLRPLEIERA
jgi:hypothetical protein